MFTLCLLIVFFCLLCCMCFYYYHFFGEITLYIPVQEAQLLQRDRATLGVVEYFAKSLNATEGRLK